MTSPAQGGCSLPGYITICLLSERSLVSKEDVEKCKQKDLLEQTMSEMIGEFPALHQTIVAERDIYLTHTLRQAARCVEAPPNAQSTYFCLSTGLPVRSSFSCRKKAVTVIFSK